MNLAINVDNIVKIYKVGFFKKKIRVLNGVSFSVEKGKTFGLLGPNGAGKTTTIKTLVGLTKPTKGKITVLNKPPTDVRTHRRIGYLPENPYIYTYLTGMEFMYLCGDFFQISGKTLRTRVNEVTDLVGLEKTALKKQLKTYSKGMLQRIGIAQALLNDPEIIFLDEPMSGLDPLGRHDIKNIIKHLKKNNKTVFFNSHILADVAELCDHVAIMAGGKIIKEGTIEDLTTPVNNLYRVYIKDLNKMGRTNLKRASLKLARGKEENSYYAAFNDLESAIKGMTVAKQSGGKVIEMTPYTISLEESFVETIKEYSNDLKEGKAKKQ